MTTDTSTLDCVIAAVTSKRYTVNTETELQAALTRVLTHHGLDPQREVGLGVNGRVDLLCGDVAIEVKVKGSSVALFRQCQRYAESGRVGGVVAVTTVPKHLNDLGAIEWLCRDRVPFRVVLLQGTGI